MATYVHDISRNNGNISVVMTDCEDNDFAQGVTKLRASTGSCAVVWKLPTRLLRNEQICEFVLQELVDELHDKQRHS